MSELKQRTRGRNITSDPYTTDSGITFDHIIANTDNHDNPSFNIKERFHFDSQKGDWEGTVAAEPTPNNNAHTNNETESTKSNPIISLFKSVFLPVGYPHTVSSDYGVFQVCDTIQALCSYLRGLLSTRATLMGIGVGNASATATSATIQFIFRDLAGLLGGVLFSWKFSNSFGTEIKQWRLFADCINDAALTLELAAPLIATYFSSSGEEGPDPYIFLSLLCIASVFKSLCGMSAGATRVAICKHFALQDNETDVSSKENIQETFVTLLGMLLGLLFTSMLPETQTVSSVLIIWFVFILLTLIHVVCNWLAVRSLNLRTLNRDRGIILMDKYIDTQCKELPSCEMVSKYEHIWGFISKYSVRNMIQFMSNSIRGGYSQSVKNDEYGDGTCYIQFGSPVYQLTRDWMLWNMQGFNKNKNEKQNEMCKDTSQKTKMEKNRMFLIGCNEKHIGRVDIIFHKNICDDDILKALLQACIVKKWLFNELKEIKQNDDMSCLATIPKPNGNLLLTDGELDEFIEKLNNSRWYIANLQRTLKITNIRTDWVYTALKRE